MTEYAVIDSRALLREPGPFLHRGFDSVTEAAEKPKGFIVKADGKSPQKDFLRSLLGKAEANQPETIIAWLDATQEGGRDGGISRAIDKLKENPKDTAEELEALAEAWAAENSDIPGDEADLPPADNGKQETLA